MENFISAMEALRTVCKVLPADAAHRLPNDETQCALTIMDQLQVELARVKDLLQNR